jgi:uncharacterized protein YndB with AHSA1/START domain
MKKKKVAPANKPSQVSNAKSKQLSPVAKAEMLIRRPVADVFEAFVNPEITAGFWFTRGSGRLEPGKQFRWDWEMYGFSLQVKVKTIETNARIVIEWPGEGAPTLVEWTFTPRPDGTTFVSIKHTGFTGEPQAMVQEAIGSTEGFTLVLAGLKGLLEHEVSLNLVSDRFPDGLGNLNPNSGG